ncbi:Elongation of very long chain fatty acids protein 4 [Galemys pyrenaicus]|uniref:Elongation of very long chain fatty acids protein n=1 Tax=Galemys pyrenaicus TaxID=202257 RepID=A0A8J6DH14_GALPY|nr:Elongation of very long chain fatty acids protein 4 [Galemys pyrenaicus]
MGCSTPAPDCRFWKLILLVNHQTCPKQTGAFVWRKLTLAAVTWEFQTVRVSTAGVPFILAGHRPKLTSIVQTKPLHRRKVLLWGVGLPSGAKAEAGEPMESKVCEEQSRALAYGVSPKVRGLVMAGARGELWSWYTWALENGDPRTDSWLLVHSPLPVTLLFGLYLLLVAAGPALMRHRQPLRLAGPLTAYNLGLVVLSGYIFYEFMVTSFLANYSYFCQPVDYSQRQCLAELLPPAQQMASVCWWCFFSKAIELLDTVRITFLVLLDGLGPISWVFFILRKKQEQLTFLHVYHHGTMLFNWWAGVKYVPGGQAFFVGMLNSFVHVFMYLYYGLASLGPRMRRYLWWKRHLTTLQLGQFVAIAAHSSYNLFAECSFPDGFNMAVLLYSLSLILLFLNFYHKTYLRGKQEKFT